MSRGRVGGVNKDLRKAFRDLEDRDYIIERDGSDHFMVKYHGEFVCSVPQTPSSVGLAKIELAAKVKRFERAHGMLEEPVKSRTIRPRKRQAPRMSGFTLPSGSGWVDAPSRLQPSAHTVASILGEEKMRELAEAVMPKEDFRSKPRRHWTEAEKAAILGRHLTTPKGQKGALIKELGIHPSHITYWTRQFKTSGAWKRWNLDNVGEVVPQESALPPAEDMVEFVTVPEVAEVFYDAVPSMDPDDEIRELTSRWSELAISKRALLATRAPFAARIAADTAEVERIDAQSADVAEELGKVRRRLSELVGEE